MSRRVYLHPLDTALPRSHHDGEERTSGGSTPSDLQATSHSATGLSRSAVDDLGDLIDLWSQSENIQSPIKPAGYHLNDMSALSLTGCSKSSIENNRSRKLVDYWRSSILTLTCLQPKSNYSS